MQRPIVPTRGDWTPYVVKDHSPMDTDPENLQ